MCQFFSCIVTRNFAVLTDPNDNSHEKIIITNHLDDKIPVDDERRDWVRIEVTPVNGLFGKDWKVNVDEKIKPKWWSSEHEAAALDYLRKNFLYTAWFKRVQKEVQFISTIKYLQPMRTPSKKMIMPQARKIAAAFKLRGPVEIEIINLKPSAAESAAWSAARSAARSAAESAAWSAAESAARSAARSAAWSAAESAARSAAWSAARSAAWSAAESAARSAAFEVSVDVNKQYKTNPFKLLVRLWAKGYYACGIVEKNGKHTLVLGYIPKDG